MKGNVSCLRFFLDLGVLGGGGFTSAIRLYRDILYIRRILAKRLTVSSASNLQSTRANFDRSATFLRWTLTTGLRFFMQFWFAKRALFWLPNGLVPGYVEWLLAFPRAPRGSVSIQVWGLACSTVLQLVGSALAAVWVFVLTSGTQGTKREGIKQEGRRIDKKEL